MLSSVVIMVIYIVIAILGQGYCLYNSQICLCLWHFKIESGIYLEQTECTLLVPNQYLIPSAMLIYNTTSLSFVK